MRSKGGGLTRPALFSFDLTTMRRGRSNSTLPGFRLHPLRGDLAGYWSITVRANWRIIFRFEQGDATDVDLVDYH